MLPETVERQVLQLLVHETHSFISLSPQYPFGQEVSHVVRYKK
jgi:hypothetical protein